MSLCVRPALRIENSLKKTAIGGAPVIASPPKMSAAPASGRSADQPAHGGNFARSHRQQRGARGKETKGLGHRMTDDLLHRAVIGDGRAESDRRQDDAHVLDGGEGEQPLVITHLQQ